MVGCRRISSALASRAGQVGEAGLGLCGGVGSGMGDRGGGLRGGSGDWDAG